MKKINTKGFTLVELLVVITILAIISVVAYQNFGGATEKALSGRKINDVATIESALMQYKSDKNYYPAAGLYNANTNIWGYNSGTGATPSNSLVYSLSADGTAIQSITTASSNGGGQVLGSGSLGQIGAKGTIGQEQLLKQYLSKDLYDPELGDKKTETGTGLITYGIGRYVYGVYNKSTWGSNNLTGKAYNIAYTVKDTQNDTYKTKIVGDYDEKSCGNDELSCPNTLIGSLSGSTVNEILKDGNSLITGQGPTSNNQGIPYPVNIQ